MSKFDINTVKMDARYQGEECDRTKGAAWWHDAWTITLRHQGRKLETPFKMGRGHHGTPPTLAVVLSCLRLDAQSADQTFEDWCADFGYDDDSREAERTYKACCAMDKKLRRLLGAKYGTFLNTDFEALDTVDDTERKAFEEAEVAK